MLALVQIRPLMEAVAHYPVPTATELTHQSAGCFSTFYARRPGVIPPHYLLAR